MSIINAAGSGELKPPFFICKEDFFASIVVFLIALPLCMGIAIASGLPPAVGLITGVVGGLAVGPISGSPLLVSGPAAGLAVIVWDVVNQQGILALGPIVLVAGILQMLVGVLRLGQWFRAVPPAVIHGMLAGIGISIVTSQIYVMMDQTAPGNNIQNIINFPSAIVELLSSDAALHVNTLANSAVNSSSLAALSIGLMTIAIIVLWNKYAPKKLKNIPGPLVGIIIAALTTYFFNLQVTTVNLPSNLLDSITLTEIPQWSALFSTTLISTALVIAFIASAETLLSASAVDQMHQGAKTDYDKELFAQGVGNSLCGFLGALPITGVIARSGANVNAGAKTRMSTILHACWILLFVALLPFVLKYVPIAALAAILVVVGVKLVELKHIVNLHSFSKREVAIYAVTVFTIVATSLLDGVLIGLGLAAVNVLYSLLNLQIEVEEDKESRVFTMVLEGSATFVQLPKLAKQLDRIPGNAELHIDTKRVNYMDSACIELIEHWAKRHKSTGGLLCMDLAAVKQRFHQSKRALKEAVVTTS
jgi:MFS superfamily sulfate permease-like transporter